MLDFNVEVASIATSPQKVNCDGFARFVLLGIFSRMNRRHIDITCRHRVADLAVIEAQKPNECG